MRGEKELLCLTQIQKALQGISQEQEMICMLCPQKQETVKNIISAKPNPQSSLFPDFIFDGGFIEHFEITAAKETKKGSELRRESKSFEQSCDEQFQKFKKENDNLPHDTMMTQNFEMVFEENNYENFVKSFQKNWEHHIDSLNKYSGDKKCGIFLIENNGATFKQMKNGEYLGDLYRLSLDKRLLEYMLPFQNQIRCVIFKDAQNYEIIETERIRQLLKKIPRNLYFEAGRVCQLQTQINFVL